jgi:hypothetical protein
MEAAESSSSKSRPRERQPKNQRDVLRRFEEIAKGDALRVAFCRAPTDLSDLQFEGTDQPAVFLVEGFERRPTIEIKRTDVTPFFDLARLVLEQDAKRKTLRPTHIGSIRVDTTGAGLIKESAATDRMRFAVLQEFRMRSLNPFGFDRRDAQIIHAAGGTTTPTLEPIGMRLRQ